MFRGFEGEGEGSNLTLIERETLAAVEREYDIEPGVHRRNVTTIDGPLNHLVGRRFRVGDAVREGIELCEPWSYLERHLDEAGVREALVHRGGLRARILEGASIAETDRIGHSRHESGTEYDE